MGNMGTDRPPGRCFGHKSTMKKLVILSLAAAAVFGGYAQAAQYGTYGNQKNIVQQGVKSLGVAGYYMTTKGSHTTNFNIALSEFVSSTIEVRGGLNYLDINGSNSTAFLVGGRYYFHPSQEKQSLPFVGVFAGFNSGSGNSNTTVGLEAGLQYFLQPNVSLTPALQYSSTSGHGGTTFGLSLGLTYWFK